jgi:hypothetical protein
MNGGNRFLGIVEQQRFQPLGPNRVIGGPVRLTRIAMQAAQTPESAEPRMTPQCHSKATPRKVRSLPVDLWPNRDD